MDINDIKMENIITVYGKDNCDKCQSLITKLKELNKPFAYNNDINVLRIIGSCTKIMSAPIINDNGNWYSYEDYIKGLNE